MAERRPDPTNPPNAKKTYTKDQFYDFYGALHGKKMWRTAGKLLSKRAADAGVETRPDPTNPPTSKKKYTREQFLEFYGEEHGPAMWKKGGKLAKSWARMEAPKVPKEKDMKVGMVVRVRDKPSEEWTEGKITGFGDWDCPIVLTEEPEESKFWGREGHWRQVEPVAQAHWQMSQMA